MLPDKVKTFSVPEIARHFRVAEETVHAWIESGDMPAINVARDLTLRRRWRVTPQGVADFEEFRRSPARSTPAVRSAKLPPVTRHFR